MIAFLTRRGSGGNRARQWPGASEKFSQANVILISVLIRLTQSSAGRVPDGASGGKGNEFRHSQRPRGTGCSELWWTSPDTQRSSGCEHPKASEALRKARPTCSTTRRAKSPAAASWALTRRRNSCDACPRKKLWFRQAVKKSHPLIIRRRIPIAYRMRLSPWITIMVSVLSRAQLRESRTNDPFQSPGSRGKRFREILAR